AFCDENGCAVQMFVGGHDKAGKYYEDSEVLFFWSNEEGKITRIEVFDDWVNMQDLMGRIAGLPPEQMDYAKWGAGIRKILGKETKATWGPPPNSASRMKSAGLNTDLDVKRVWSQAADA